MKLLDDGIRELLMLSYTNGVCLLYQGFDKGKYIQSLSLALQKTDSILSDALQLLLLWSSPQIRMVVLHFDAAANVIGELQLRSNILDFTEEQQADCTDLNFIEARYNTKLKNVLLSDRAFT